MTTRNNPDGRFPDVMAGLVFVISAVSVIFVVFMIFAVPRYSSLRAFYRGVACHGIL